MKIAEAIQRIELIVVPDGTTPVYRTAAEELARIAGAPVRTGQPTAHDERAGVFRIAPAVDLTPPGGATSSAVFRLTPDGSGFLTADPPHLLFGFLTYLLRRLAQTEIERVAEPATFPATFAWQRSVYDYFLTQEGRIQRGLHAETYVRRLAECGFTHLEVNGLAFPMGLETGPRGEAYPMFYTYCPALDQFVSSGLNRGLYPDYYLSANLAQLRFNAALARRYGLVPGLLCFEPRSVPEEFFARYPMLRGARVDHPFRSFKPRYNMTIAHPRVREHYAEMMARLMDEVPELAFLSVWTNDSGAGFEHTSSLYVGRNGGAYLIREWRDHADIARTAAENALWFLRVLRDAGRAINPEFRVITRLEPFTAERETIWGGLRDGLEAEAASLTARGWEMPYTHPRYADSHAINIGSIHQSGYEKGEGARARELEARGSRAHQYHAARCSSDRPHPTPHRERLARTGAGQG
ncbi:MAG: hypothetical protein SYC29_06165, partial [Planctomycetota bacterium]|nr:hypothetical protein [Planctomycetota bacterium]